MCVLEATQATIRARAVQMHQTEAGCPPVQEAEQHRVLAFFGTRLLES